MPLNAFRTARSPFMDALDKAVVFGNQQQAIRRQDDLLAQQQLTQQNALDLAASNREENLGIAADARQQAQANFNTQQEAIKTKANTAADLLKSKSIDVFNNNLASLQAQNTDGKFPPQSLEAFARAGRKSLPPKGDLGTVIGASLAAGLSTSDRSKGVAAFIKKGKGVKRAVKSFDSVIDSIIKNPETVTLSGTASEGLKAIEANLAGLGKALGFDAGNIDLSINSIDNAAAKSASARANIKKLVRDFARSLGESGQSFSDKDLIDFTQQITARWGNPSAIVRVLSDRRNQLVSGFNSDSDIDVQAGIISEKNRSLFNFSQREPDFSNAESTNTIDDLVNKHRSK